MKLTVNLLPWRQYRRTRRAYRWAIVIALYLSISLFISLFIWLYGELSIRQKRLESVALMKLHSVMLERKKQTFLYKKEGDMTAQHRLRQQKIRIWESRFPVLANILPDDMWLTRLALEDDVIQLQGRAQTFAAFARFERAVYQLPGITAVKIGSLQRTNDSHLTFSMMLIPEG